MALVEIKIPQLGEGLQEARLVRFIKQPGEAVAQDEPIYEMETDKALMEIEAPAAGVLEAWTAQVDDVLPIGATVGRINTDGIPSSTPGSPEQSITEAFEEPPTTAPEESAPDVAVGAGRRPGPGPAGAKTAAMEADTGAQPGESDSLDSRLSALDSAPPSPPLPLSPSVFRAGSVPPRTRAYARQMGLSDEELVRVVQQTEGRVLPEAIDRYLKSRPAEPAKPERRARPRPVEVPAEATGYKDVPLPPRQRTLAFRLQRGTRDVIPATMEIRVGWSAVEAVRAQLRQSAGTGPQPTQFLLFAWCVAQAARNHPRFRSALLNDSTLREYDHLHLGIAVARPEDELLLARVQRADALTFQEFVAEAQEAISKARGGVDQTADVMQLSLTNMAGAGVRLGIPVVAAPAAGTLFVGEPFDEAYPLPGGGIGFRRQATMVFSFDHRVANGIGAANFLNEVRSRVERLQEEFPPAS